ncbi:MAG: DUF1501 domain-containing protein [Phycisphaeraceae bacterium]|nr:DUF1501 domain-containing protein [Phycisphaeraceae bacterium]
MHDDQVPYSRRRFIQHGVALASLASTIPSFIQRSALGMLLPGTQGRTSLPGVPQDHVLVIVQLGGGNDGLNTVVPYGAPEYFRARPTLAVAEPGGQARGGAGVALELDRSLGLGLNPALEAMKALHDDGLLSIVQGVGYPNPNRSHFASMDIWETARLDGKGEGWIGRYFDNTCGGTPIPEGAIHIGRSAPLAMMGTIQKPVSFESADLFRWLGDDVHEALRDPYQAINRAGPVGSPAPGSQRDFLMRTALDAQVASDRIRAAVRKQPLVRYPQSDIARQLQVVGALIRDGLQTRVFYVSKGGFDTHANQPGGHANILRQVAEALRAFNDDLRAQGNQERVLTMVFSEFGRRVQQNASQGTDHGTAAPMFLMGPMVRPGIVGHHPNLADLDFGDLRFGLDFRGVYAAILEQWMGVAPEKVLGGRFAQPPILRA